MMEKCNNFFKECRNTDENKVLLAGNGESAVATTAPQHSMDPAFGGALFQEPSGGPDGTLHYFIQVDGTESYSKSLFSSTRV